MASLYCRRRSSLALCYMVPLLLEGDVAVAAVPPVTLKREEAEQLLHQMDARLYLELVVNEYLTGKVVPVDSRNQDFFIEAGDLRQIGLPLDDEAMGQIPLSSIAGLTAEYESVSQRLFLTVPPAWLPEQTLGRNSIFERIPPQTSTGAVINYDVYSAHSDQGGSYSSMLNEVRFFGQYGVLRNSSVYQHIYGGGASNMKSYLRRYDTAWTYSDDENAITYELGDYVNNALAWSTSVRLGGIQIARDFSVRPDLITYPLPQFSGESAVPTTVDLFVNGYKTSSSELLPGPFTLTNVPYINGAGEAVVVTTDALGRQVSTTMPFYVSSSLLSKGLADYSASIGSIRRNYGIRDFDYGPGAASGIYRYGLSNYLTVESHAEVADSFHLGGLGSIVRLGNFGVLNTAYSQSRMRGRRGDQFNVGYQYSRQRFSFGAQHQARSSGYRDISVYDRDSEQQYLSKSSTQANLTIALDVLGSISVGYFDIRSHDDSRTRLINLSWGKSLWGNTYFSLSANREVGESRWSTVASLSIPLGNRQHASASIERTADKVDTHRVNYNRSIASDGGFGWSLGYANSDRQKDYQQATLRWRGDAIQIEGGAYGNSDNYTEWLDLRGSLVWIDNALHAANEIGDAFVLVSTDGQPGIPVHYENQLIGETDEKGHVLIPWSTSYYGAKYSVDPLGLNSNYDVPNVEQRIAVRGGSGYVVHFPIRRVVAANIALVDARGDAVPMGTGVYGEDGVAGHVGWDGLVYLEGLKEHNRLQVQMPGQASCSVDFDLDVLSDEVAFIGPLECK